MMRKNLPLVMLFSGAWLIGLDAATFTSIASGDFNTASTWTFIGVDANGIPDSDDDVTIDNGHTVTLAASGTCRNLTTNPTGTFNYGAQTVLNYGSLTNNGSLVGSGGWRFQATGTYTGNPLPTQGSLYFYGHYTLAAGTSISKSNGTIIIGAGVIVTNNGIVQLNHFSNGYIQFLSTSSRWINAANSILAIGANFVGSGILTATAVPNTINYKGNSASTIFATSYYNLVLNGSSAHTKALAGNINVANNLTIQTNVTLNWANFNISLGGNWVNNANTTCTNMGQITFTGTGTQNITRTPGNSETLNNVTITGGGTVLLNDSLRINGNLDISSGTLDVSANNYTIRIQGTFMDNSSFNARNGTVFFTGTAAQTIDGFATTTFYNITSNNSAGVSINFTKQISNILQVNAGSFGPSGFGSIILLATGATTYAKIGPLGAGASLTGNTWSVQTYINGPATAYWQYLGTPTNLPTLQDWDGDTRFYMSGVGGNDGNACCPTFYSVRTYAQATNTYTNVTTVNATLQLARGYMVWMADNLSSLTAPLIFDTRGTPNFGTINRAVGCCGSGNGYNLVSNPFACPVTFANVVAASSATLSPNFVILQENGSYATNPNGGTIAPAQGFMCVASTAGNITFPESCKTTSATPNVVRIAGNEIKIKAGNVVNGLGEETVLKLNPGGSESYDAAVDMPYLISPYDNATHIYTQNQFGEQFLLNNLGTEDDHLMIPLAVVTSTPGTQMLTFKNLNTVTEYNCAWLEDLTTGERVNLNEVDTYQFNEDVLGTTRNFVLHFERTSDCTFQLQNSTASLDAQTNVYTNGESIYAQFEFGTEQVVTVSMFDISGRMVMSETTMNVTSQTVALTTPDAHGVYLVRIQKGNEVCTKKIYY